jgi:hypothetical protein
MNKWNQGRHEDLMYHALAVYMGKKRIKYSPFGLAKIVHLLRHPRVHFCIMEENGFCFFTHTGLSAL